jgi:ATP-binding cassette, subfamily G (WHITE), member 2
MKIHHNASITSSFFEEIGGNRVKKGMCLAFQDVCFTVRYKDPQTKTMIDRKILKNCTGILKPGTLNAIMGASGGGKTSLLDVLADRKNATGVSGSVFVNGKPRDRSVFMHRSGYVVQVSGLKLEIVHDDLNDESLMTKTGRCGNGNTHCSRELDVQCKSASAGINFDRGEGETCGWGVMHDQIRLNTISSFQSREPLLKQVIEELGLGKVADQKVGDEMIRGISGGERKRVNIGMELITSPRYTHTNYF